MDVVFFPRNDYPNNIEVCSHRYGKRMAYTEQTDGQQNTGQYESYQWLVPEAKTRNIKVGIFAMVNGSISPAGGLREDYDNGHVWLDVYGYCTPLLPYINPGGDDLTGQITQEIWNEAYNDYILENFRNFTGKVPVALSYSYGRDGYKNLISQLLGGRNSGNSGYTDFGVGYGNPNNVPYSFSTFNSKPSTTRWYDTENVKPSPNWSLAIAEQGNLIDATMLNGGWLSNFTHWHNVKNDGNQSIYEDYLDMLATKNVNGEIWFCGYGEALAYLVYRQLITRAVMYSPVQNNDQLVIRLESRNTLSINPDLLQIPISVKFSTVGTPLANQTIKSDCNLISLENNQYIVEIPYAEYPCAVIEKISI